MGKITPGFKSILVFITFLGFTNLILSETKLDLTDFFGFRSAPAILNVDVSTENATQKAVLTPQASVENTLKASSNFEAPGITLTSNALQICTGETQAALSFTTTNSPTTYSINFENSAFSNVTNATLTSSPINIPIPSQLAAGTYNASITVSKGTEVGEPVNFSIQLKGVPTVNTVQDIVVCNGGLVSAITFSGDVSGTTYSWINNTISIGLPANGNGDITGFNAVNTGNTPITASVTVTPTVNGCTGEPKTFSITVNPTPTLNTITNVVVCNGGSVSAINFSGNIGGATYSWTNNNPSIGLPTSGSGNIINFNAVNTGNTPVTATLTVTPSADNCTGESRTFTITVHPTPTVNTVADVVVCNGVSVSAINFSGSVTGAAYSWTNTNSSIGLAASGTGNIPTFNAVNTGTTPVTGTISVTPAANTCTGEVKTFTITVNPTPTVNTVTNVVVCNGGSVSPINFAGNVTGAVYSWTNTNSSIGLAASGTGNIPTFNAVNTGNIPVTATINVTPSAENCSGESRTFTITVNPTPTVNTVSDVVVCNGGSVPAINFSGDVNGTTYTWSNNTPSIGLAANGNGNISTFNAINTGTTPVIATITITPSANNCTADPKTFTITVNPSPTVNTVSNLIVCNGASVSAITFSGAVSGTNYSWSNNTSSIGLASTGTGNITGFNAVNTGTTPVTATITVTPEANGCAGDAKTFTITVNPTPTVNTVVDVIVCNGGSVSAINFSGDVSGTSYSWTNTTPSIGLASSGTGNLPVFNAVNTGNSPVTATITVTPVASGCTGNSKTFTITVNPTPTVISVSNVVVCNGGSVPAINFTGNVSGSTYSWTNNNASIGLAANGTGNISTFNAVNSGTTPVIATITVTPAANACTGVPKTFTITVNPTPTVGNINDVVVCTGASVAAINFAGPVTGTTFSWTNNNPLIGLAASGNGNLPSFTSKNTGSTPLVATITVTPRANNCNGVPFSFTITIDPTPGVNRPMFQVACNESIIQDIIFTGSNVSGTTYRWENNNTSIGLAASGTGNIASFTAINTSGTKQTAEVTVYPQSNGCEGPPQTFTIVINPAIIVMEPPLITPPSCFGESNGSMEVRTIIGGNGDFRYSLDNSNFGSSKIFTGLSAGTYTLYITDTESCSHQENFIVGQPAELSMTNPVSTPTSCFGSKDGTVTAGTVTGGNGGYQYSVDNTNFTTSPTITGLAAGTHTIFVKDSKGCSFQKTVNVSDPVKLTGTVTRTSVSCNGGNDGSIIITNAAGGSGNFEYSINGTAWQNSATFSGLSTGTYNVQIRDKNAASCVVILQPTYQMPQPAEPVTVDVVTTRTLSFGTETGTATANPTGGTPGYTYEWRKQGQNAILQITKTANNLAAGKYVVTVKDSKGCTTTKEVTIIEDLYALIIPTSICENTDALIRTSFFEVENKTAKGGVAPYTYLWNFGSGASLASAATPGPHRVTYSATGDKTITLTVTDATGATKTFSYVQYVGECFRDNCGSNDIAAAAYFVGDENGNVVTSSTCELPGKKYVYLNIPTGPTRYSLYVEINYAITHLNTNEVTRETSGGCFYEKMAIPLTARTFEVDWKCGDVIKVESIYFTFSNNISWGCGQGPNPKCFSTNAEQTVSTPLYAIATPNEILCHAERTGNITVTATGGRAPYQYSLTGTANSYQTGSTFGNLTGGTYKVFVRDSQNEVFEINNINIVQPVNPLSVSVNVGEILCFGGVADATAVAAGGTPPYTYIWNDAAEQPIPTALGLKAGNYTVTVMDKNGCQILKGITITEPAQLSVANAGPDQVFSCGFNSTFLGANTPATGVGNWEIISGTGGNITETANPTSAFTGSPGTYTLRWSIAHANGTCGTSDEVNITFVEDCSTLDFDGVDDHVTFGNNYGLNNGTFTLEAWIKPKSVNGVRTILSKRNFRDLGVGGYDLIINNGAPTFRWGNNAVSTSSKVNNSRWYHVAVIFTDGRANLYVDGIRVGNSSAINPVNIANPFIIGAMYDASNPEIPINYFHGWIEEVRIWNTGLTEEQLRFMMNQRIEAQGTAIKGTELPMNVPGGLTWDKLSGYYRLMGNETQNGLTPDMAINKISGELKNITTTQENTAPLPYISAADGVWRDKGKWLRPDVWEYPNATGINGENINWNIAEVHHNFTSGGKDLSLLGLVSENGTLTMANPNQTADWQNSGQGLFITHYLKLNGNIILEGESQLVQTDIRTTLDITNPALEYPQSITSVLDESSTGYIERAQQGTANSYNYNYWSSPVSLQGAANNSTYTIGQVMLDGSATTNYGQTLSFHPWHEFADGPYSTPRKISNYWLYKFRGTVNVYSEWAHIGSTGVLLAGEGYTMKGTSGQAAIGDRQNYIFRGKPNNGSIRLTIGTDQNYLLGNPYPSAIDVNAFIMENLRDVTGGKNTQNIFNGAVYFWDHFAGGNTHILLEYIGGYATRNLLDGVPAISNDARITANDARSNKVPGRFIPVGQGFFINTSLDPESANNIVIHGGEIQFNNSQREFVRESTGNTGSSLFLQQEKNLKTSAQEDTRAKIRLDFKSPKKYNRQILVGVDPNTTSGFDLGYDAALNDNNSEDMYWLINKREYIIQGVPDFNPERILALGIKIAEEGEFSIKINKLENVPDNVNIYLKDNKTNSYYDLRKNEYKLVIPPGTYNERFEIVFQIKTETGETTPDEGDEEEEEEEEEEEAVVVPVEGGEKPEDNLLKVNPEIFFLNNSQELVVRNPGLQVINQITLHSMSGQIIENYENIATQKEIRLPVRNYSSSVYLVKMFTENGIIHKKLIINN